MNWLSEGFGRDLVDVGTLTGAVVWAVVFLALAHVVTIGIRRTARRIEPRLTDVTGLHFLSLFAQVVTYILAFILYAHLVPALRALGTALLAGAGVVSVVTGLAAQNTLGNVVAGISLVLYRPISTGDRVQLGTPRGVATATVEFISLGHTLLRDHDGNEIIVPNSVMMSSVLIRLGGRRAPDSASS